MLIRRAERISLQEFLDGGPEGLPSFAGYKDLGREWYPLAVASQSMGLLNPACT